MTSLRPVLTVVIPCYQAADTLPLQLRALSTQREAPQFELLIVDNRSTDSLREVVSDHHDLLTSGGATSVRIIEALDEAGASYARNVGAAHASTELLVFCDADDCVSQRWLADAAALFSQADAFSGSAIPVPNSEFSADPRSARAIIEPAEEPPLQVVGQDDLAIPILMGGDFGMRRSVFLELGGFDQSLPSSGEDNDFAFRLRAAGYPVLDSPNMRIAYRMRDTGPARRRIACRAAESHVLLCQRYGVYSSSAFVGQGRLLRATARLPLAAIKMLLSPAPRDVDGLATRAAGIMGFWLGAIKYRVLGRVPSPRLGVGLTPRDP